MKTRRIVPLIALAALVTACAAPIQAPILQQPKAETATLPFQEQAKGEQALPFELPAAPAEETAPEIPTFEVPVAPAPLAVGRTDPSAYPAEVEALMAPAPVQMYPADELRDFGQIRGAEEQKYSQPIPMYPPDELRDFGQIRGGEEQKYSQPLPVAQVLDRAQERALYQSGFDQTDPSAYPAEVAAVVNAPHIGRTDPSAYPAEIEAVVHAPYIGQADPSAYPAEIQAIATP